MSPSEAESFVRTYFSSGSDQSLPLSFKVGKNGQLESAPTLRTALLDHLAAINPTAAAALGREILANPTSPDEWALALRNVAQVEPDSRDFLRQKTEELIRNPEWQAAPSVGYLNAFDVLVHTRARESTPLLSEFLQDKSRRDLAHASFLTLDRLTMAAPGEMLPLIAADSALHQARPEMAAQQMARADFRETAQVQTVRSWLLAPERTPTELQSFAETFPNGNMMVSDNLLTTQKEFEGQDLRERDRQSLDVIESWIESAEFQPIRTELQTMKARLEEFVEKE